MEASKNDTSTSSTTKTGLESLSKEELLTKYKSLLNIAKKAKQAKDEFAAENLLLKEALQRNETQKEADKNALLTMKETLEQFTEQKLLLSTQYDELRQQSRQEKDLLSQLRIENESLRRQMESLTTDNESLLNEMESMESQLKQVNVIGMEQKKHLEQLEIEVNRLKERESHTASLEQRLNVSLAENKALMETENLTKKSLNELNEKYQHVKEINTQQRHKFNALKERFVDVYRKLKKLKECKVILLETQQEYAEAVSKWQNEIINGARELCKQLHSLKAENEALIKQLNTMKDVENKPNDGNIKLECNKDESFVEQTVQKEKNVDFVHKLNIEMLATQLKDLENMAKIALEEENQLKSIEKPADNLSETQTKADELLKKLENTEKALADVMDKYAQLEIKFKTTENSNTKLQNDCKNFKMLHELKLTESDQISAANTKLVMDLAKLNEELKEKTEQQAKLENEISKLKALCSERARLLDEIKEKNELTSEKNNKTNAEVIEKLKATENDFKNLKENYEKLEKSYKENEALNLSLSKDCENLKAQLLENEAKLKDLSNLKEQLAEKAQQHEELAKEITLQEQNNEATTALEQELRALEVSFLNQKQDYEKILIEKTEIESKNQFLVENLEMHKTKLENLETTLAANEKMAADFANVTQELAKYRQLYEDLLARHELKAREHTDLLAEMRELNEALKKRGDLISRQEARQNELNGELKRLQQFEQALKEKEKLIQQKDDELKEINEAVKTTQAKVEELTTACTRSEAQYQALTHELQRLRDGELKDDTQSDNISITSSMSRAESINQLRDVDESYEERYVKLKTLAMKLKKKLQEQTAHANELAARLKEREAALEAQEKLNESLTKENKKLKSNSKQSNMLNLEIEAAEKSLSDVSAKLTAKNSELNELKAVLETKESTIVQLRKELAIVEAAKASECEHGKELKAQIDLLQTQIKDAVHSKQIVLDTNKDLEHSQETLKLEIEDLRLQLAQSESKQVLKVQTLTTENSQLQEKLSELEATLTATQQKLKSTERSLDELRIEHTDYKLKAQTVLRKQQTKDTTLERELAEELQSVRKQLQQMEQLVENLKHKLETSEKQLEMLNEDNASLQQRKADLTKLNEELRLQNEALLQEQRSLLQAQQDALRQQRQQIENLDECHKSQMERLESNYEKQLQALKTELTKAATTAATTRPAPLIGAVAKTTPPKNELQHTDLAAHLLMEREAAEGSESANVVTLQSLASSKRKISSNSSNTQRRSLHELMPLDELLNAPLNALNTETTMSANNNLLSAYLDDSVEMSERETVEQSLELQAAKARLQIQESRVRHLTALLAENEQDLAKLTQMNDMLKEELRRQERSVEREQHMHNSEYLKNVIIKFITLNSVDERTRLVPVLNTILKLSRAEVEMLNCAAKGQKVSESPRSWSNFLPSWGGGAGVTGNNGN